MSIELDATRYSVVVTCTDCAPFYRLASSKREGWRIGADHEERAHPEKGQARDTLGASVRRD